MPGELHVSNALISGTRKGSTIDRDVVYHRLGTGRFVWFNSARTIESILPGLNQEPQSLSHRDDGGISTVRLAVLYHILQLPMKGLHLLCDLHPL